jgi:hypothetical protein
MEIKENQKFKPDPKLKLMDQTRQVLRYHACHGKRYFLFQARLTACSELTS